VFHKIKSAHRNGQRLCSSDWLDDAPTSVIGRRVEAGRPLPFLLKQ
jgi:hypothetical protein